MNNIDKNEIRKPYQVVIEGGEGEYVEKKSRFIATVQPIETEEEAIAFIDSVKKRYPDARHHVYAYVLRENSAMSFTDDHEPAGTAGMPVLDIIRKNGCTDTVIVVTRYFGGTLLGTGGLVRAYTSAALGALESAEIIRYDIYSSLKFSVSYSDYGKITSALSDLGFRVEDTIYDTGVTLYGRIIKTNLESLKANLTELTAGRIELEILSEEFGY